MESHPKIIELCGIPGCGKSTLSRELADDKKMEIGSIGDLLAFYKKKNIFLNIRTFPYKAFIRLITAYFVFPKLKLKDWYLYVDFVKIIILYSVVRNINEYKYIVVDGGIVQSFIGLFFQREECFSKKSMERILAFMNCFPAVHVCFCNIPVEETIKRIRMRNRKYGRLDVIADDKLLDKKLTKQSILFDKLYNEMLKSSNAVSLSMMKSKESLVSDFQSILSRF